MDIWTNKPLCYGCEYRGSVAGDTHICCNHPLVVNNELIKVAALLRQGVIMLGQKPDGGIFPPLEIEANEHGVKSGWFTWPINFDPVWLENCDGFKEDEND